MSTYRWPWDDETEKYCTYLKIFTSQIDCVNYYACSLDDDGNHPNIACTSGICKWGKKMEKIKEILKT